MAQLPRGVAHYYVITKKGTSEADTKAKKAAIKTKLTATTTKVAEPNVPTRQVTVIKDPSTSLRVAEYTLSGSEVQDLLRESDVEKVEIVIPAVDKLYPLYEYDSTNNGVAKDYSILTGSRTGSLNTDYNSFILNKEINQQPYLPGLDTSSITPFPSTSSFSGSLLDSDYYVKDTTRKVCAFVTSSINRVRAIQIMSSSNDYSAGDLITFSSQSLGATQPGGRDLILKVIGSLEFNSGLTTHGVYYTTGSSQQFFKKGGISRGTQRMNESNIELNTDVKFSSNFVAQQQEMDDFVKDRLPDMERMINPTLTYMSRRDISDLGDSGYWWASGSNLFATASESGSNVDNLIHLDGTGVDVIICDPGCFQNVYGGPSAEFYYDKGKGDQMLQAIDWNNHLSLTQGETGYDNIGYYNEGTHGEMMATQCFGQFFGVAPGVTPYFLKARLGDPFEIPSLNGPLETFNNALKNSITQQPSASSGFYQNTNSVGGEVIASITLSSDTNVSTILVTGYSRDDFSAGEVITFSSQSLGATNEFGTDLEITLVQDDINTQQGTGIAVCFDLARLFHESKSINPATGVKRPTVFCMSIGSHTLTDQAFAYDQVTPWTRSFDDSEQYFIYSPPEACTHINTWSFGGTEHRWFDYVDGNQFGEAGYTAPGWFGLEEPGLPPGGPGSNYGQYAPSYHTVDGVPSPSKPNFTQAPKEFGIFNLGANRRVPYQEVGVNAAAQDMCDAGVIFCHSAGNQPYPTFQNESASIDDDYDESWRSVHYDDFFAYDVPVPVAYPNGDDAEIPAGYKFYYNRGSGPSCNKAIECGAITEESVPVSSSGVRPFVVEPFGQKGPRVDIFAYWGAVKPSGDSFTDISHARFTSSFIDSDAGDSSQAYSGYTSPLYSTRGYQCHSNGTSFSAPTTAGVIALYLQLNPSATSKEIRHWLKSNASYVAGDNTIGRYQSCSIGILYEPSAGDPDLEEDNPNFPNLGEIYPPIYGGSKKRALFNPYSNLTPSKTSGSVTFGNGASFKIK